MPRGRGGARQGTPGTAYGNRTDLNSPISTVPGQEYGKATQQRDAQRAVPMGASPVASAPPAPAPAPATQPAAPNKLPPAGSMPLIAPTSRPDEPVTEGMPFGPGANSMTIQRPTLSSMLDMEDRGSNLSTMLWLAAVSQGL